MKKITSIVCVCFALLLIKNVSFAQATTGVNDKNIFTIDADAPKNTIGISTQQYETNGNDIEIIKYHLKDGTVVTDRVIENKVILKSKKGSDTVTRSRAIPNSGSISITATFKWYEKKHFSYVECTSMSATHSFNKNIKVSKFDATKSSGAVSLGKAYAKVEYSVYNKNNPMYFNKGTFKITCTDTGTIKDND